MLTRMAVVLVTLFTLTSWHLRGACYGWGVLYCLHAGEVVTILHVPPCNSSVTGTVLASATFWSNCLNHGSCVKGDGYFSECFYVAQFINPCTHVTDCGTGVVVISVNKMVSDGAEGVCPCNDGTSTTTPGVTTPACPNGDPGPFRSPSC